MANKIQLTNSIKIFEDTNEVATRDIAGPIAIGDYVTYIDTVTPLEEKVLDFNELDTFDFFYIESDKQVSISYTSAEGPTIFVLKPKANGKALMMFTGSAITEVNIENESESDSAKIKVIFAKYETA